jgi:hypothetical protein
MLHTERSQTGTICNDWGSGAPGDEFSKVRLFGLFFDDTYLSDRCSMIIAQTSDAS